MGDRLIRARDDFRPERWAVATDTSTLGEDRIGSYRVVRVIHPGATSMVMEVVQEATQKRFALKQLLASRAEDRDERKAFEHEAKLGMELRHPNLIRVHEYVKDPIQPYFVMDYFSGYHLKLPIARPSVYPMPKAQLPPDHRAGGHRAGLHARQGLGSSRRQAREHPGEQVRRGPGDRLRPGPASRFPGLRKLFGGKIPRQGTPSYIAPEQIRCESPSPLADIYSFGITCYELACGRPPFRANSLQELLNKHLQERPIPLTTHNKLVTPEFNDLILKMIMKRRRTGWPASTSF